MNLAASDAPRSDFHTPFFSGTGCVYKFIKSLTLYCCLFPQEAENNGDIEQPSKPKVKNSFLKTSKHTPWG